MARVVVRSRSGNLVLMGVGAIYTLAAIAALIAFTVDVWDAAALTDRALAIGLIVSAACGIWFLATGLRNLGVRVGRGLPHFPHRTTGSH